MWKRLNNPKGGRPPISEPMRIETFNEKGFSGNSGLGIVNRKPSPRDTFTGNQPSGPAPKPAREDEMGPKGLPRLPFEPVQLPVAQPPDSRLRSASSIYSQPSPHPITTRFRREAYETTSTLYTDDGVSPPSSPEYGTSSTRRDRYSPSDQDVSPIEEMPDISQLAVGRPSSRLDSSSKPPLSNIPVLRREKRRNQVAAQVSAAAANLTVRKEVGGATNKGRKTVDPRWDPYSGGIATNEKGKPRSMKPGTFALPGLRQIHQPTGLVLGNESSITGPAKARTSFSDRVRNLKGRNESLAERPEWQGATRTGRTAVVSPVEDRYDLPPMSIPRKSSRRIASPESGSYSGSLTPVTIIRSDNGETSPGSAHTSDSEENTDPTIAALLASGRDSPRVSHSPVNIAPDPAIVNEHVVAKYRKSEPTEVSTLPKRDSAATIERNFREALKEVSFSGNDSADPYVQPPSRFSVTTYASSEAQSTPRPSTDTFDRHPMPTPSLMFDAPQSMLNRQRPKLGLPGSPKSTISRKAVGADQPIVISMSSSIAKKRTSNSGKNLPVTPAEAESQDLVSSLQAQLDDLANRRNNIQKSIRQMTQLMPKDSVLLTEDVRRKREAEKIKVEALRNEEADIKREEHDIGLRLHRAWKRRDKNAEYEPTGLWVRRVTG